MRPNDSATPRPGAYAGRTISVQPRRELGGRQRLNERLGGVGDVVGPFERADGPLAGALGRRGRDDASAQLRVEHRARPDLFPVVVFRVDPEHRHRRDAVLARHALGQPDGRGRLEQRENGPAEQPGLLPGDDRDGAGLREPSRRRERFGRRAAPFLLRDDDVGDFASRPRVALCGAQWRRAHDAGRPDCRRRTARRARSRTRSPRPAAASTAGGGRPPRTARRCRTTRRIVRARGRYCGKRLAGLSRTRRSVLDGGARHATIPSPPEEYRTDN